MPSRCLGLLERERVSLALAGALGVVEIDLVMLDEAGLELLGTVVQEGRLIYSADEPARVRFEVRTRSAYLDFAPTMRALGRRYVARIAQEGL